MRILTAIALGAFFATSTVAADATKEVVKATNKQAFDEVAASVRKEMEPPDGRYSYVKPDEHEKVDAALAEMGMLFDKYGSVDEMDKPTRVQLFNAQESVNAILTLRDRDRLICERAAPTGSRIVTTTCHTYGELEASRQSSRKFLDERLNTPCNAPSCSGN